jgi:hypothetical protein
MTRPRCAPAARLAATERHFTARRGAFAAASDLLGPFGHGQLFGGFAAPHMRAQR